VPPRGLRSSDLTDDYEVLAIRARRVLSHRRRGGPICTGIKQDPHYSKSDDIT